MKNDRMFVLSDAVRFQELLSSIAVPTALSVDGVLMAANEEMCRLTGRALSELLQQPLRVLLAEEDQKAVALRCEECVASGDVPAALPVRLQALDGSWRSVELHIRQASLVSGVATMLTWVDQTDILHVQSSLQGLSQMLHQIVDGAAIASLVLDSKHRVTHWNSACERLTGVPREHVLGTTEHWRAFYAESRPLLADLVIDGFDEAQLREVYQGQAHPSTAISGGIEAEVFFPHFREEGAWLYITVAPLHDAAGNVMGAIKTIQDVTERRQAQDELLRHRAELERLVDKRTAELQSAAWELELFVSNAPVGVAYSVAGVIRKTNHAIAKMLGCTEEDMTGVLVKDFHMSRQDYEEVKRLSSIAFAKAEPLRHEMWMRRTDGQQIWVQIDAHTVMDDKALKGVWWMVQDRTDFRSAQQELEARFEELKLINHKLEETQNQLLQQEKMASIGQLAAGVAHEINNPVGFVNSNLNTMRRYIDALLALPTAYEAVLKEPGDVSAIAELVRAREEAELDYLKEDLPQMLSECADGLGRVKKIVQDLKDFSRVDQAEWQDADLNAGLESTLNVVRHEVRYKADVVKHLTPLPPVTCLAAQLNQVFLNLIVNAVHAISEHGVITLSSGTEGSWAWFQVQDTGCGMSEEVRRRIFEPFFTTKEAGKGTGLGLSLSCSIVQKHGGSIVVQSVPREGSTFRVWVPVGGPQSLKSGETAPAWPSEGHQ